VSADAVVTVPSRCAYRPLGSRAGAAKKALGLVIAVNAIAIVSGVAEYRLLERAETVGVTDAELARTDVRQGLIALAQLALLAAACVFFLRWFHRAYANLGHLDAEQLRYGRRWAIGAWFVPILNLFRPKQMADDIWRVSDPRRAPGEGWRDAKVPSLLSWWWATFLLAGLLGNLAGSGGYDAADISDLKASAIKFLVADAVSIVAAVLAILVVSRITERQEARASRLRAT
jgi:Domain of unknown function (DUF4328)